MAIITKKTESPIAWGEIKEAVKAGKAAEILHVGDEIAETLTTGEQVVFVVAGIGVYAENQVIFSLKNCLAEEYRMNEDWTNKGGWPACDMRGRGQYLALFRVRGIRRGLVRQGPRR